MKELVLKLLPGSAVNFLRRIKHHFDDQKYSKKSAQEVFTDIYRNRKWGTEGEKFDSGPGTSDAIAAKPYIDLITDFLKTQNDAHVVDLGCGDFSIGQNFVPHCASYKGVDVVPDLIEAHSAAGYGDHVSFHCIDIAEEELPEGNICFVRQVLQHLSNEQVSRILTKLKKYKTVFITEHYPVDNPDIIPNKNIVHGSRVRVYDNSGVFLDKPPFSIPTESLDLVLEVPGIGFSKGCDPGIIRTFKIQH